MSGAAQSDSTMQKHKDATVTDSKDGSQPLQAQKPAAQLEEDDEFEDFPVEGMRLHKHFGAERVYADEGRTARLGKGRGSWGTSEQHAFMGGELGRR